MRPLVIISFLLFGLAHGLTVFPVLAAISTLLVVIVSVRARHLVNSLNQKVLLLTIGLALYLCLNEILHGHPDHLWDIRFYRAQGKSLYMLFLFGALYILPGRTLRDGLSAACIGFAVGAIAVQVGAYVLGFKSPLLEDLAISVLGGHNAISGLIAQVVIATFVFARLATTLRWRVFLWTTCGLSFAFFVLGVSRANTIGLLFAISLGYFLTVRRHYNVERQFFLTFAPYLLLITLIGTAALIHQSSRWTDLSDDRNITSRLVFWKRALGYAQDGLFFGTGLGGFSWQGGQVGSPGIPLLIATTSGGKAPWESDRSLTSAGIGHVHNVYLQILTESGLIGLTLWASFFIFIVRRSIGVLRNYPRRGDEAMFSVVLLCLLTYALVAGFANGLSLMSPSTAFLMYVVAPYVCRIGSRTTSNTRLRNSSILTAS